MPPPHENPEDEADSMSECESDVGDAENSRQDAEQSFQSIGQAVSCTGTSAEQPSVWPTEHRLAVLEKAVVDMAQILVEKERANNKPQHNDPDWGCGGRGSIGNGSTNPGGPTIKLDQLRPFPKDVPSNRLWEEWRKYLENFEIAASLHPNQEPDKLAKILFLAVGEDLQGIIRAARLRPNLEGPDCYRVFIKNIDTHLRSMTDTTTEHETFLAMRQDVGESPAAFHARLVDRARLCGYGQGDEDRFVRSQLIKGLRDREIAKSARLFNYDTNFIVQAATRSEAYEPVAGPSNADTVLAVDHEANLQREGRKRSFNQESERNSGRQGVSYRGTSTRNNRGGSQRGFGHGKRFRCSRCDRWRHENPQQCPAIRAKCFECGATGHFAATCRRKGRVSTPKNEEGMSEVQV